MEISFAANFREVERDLSDFARKQLPFATSLALNDTAEAVERGARRDLETRLDKPTPFTLRGLLILRSSKARLWADVLIKDAQAAYLRWQETGGDRPPKAKAIPVPVHIGRDSFGNMARGAVKRAALGADVFSGRPGRAGPGLFQRLKGGGLRLLVAFEPVAKYRPRLHFADNATRIANAMMPAAFERAMRRALTSAR